MADAPELKVVGKIEDAVAKRQDQPFFVVLPRPHYPNCSHDKRGVELDTVTRTVRCNCGEPIDPFDALLIYAGAEQRLISTRNEIERHKQDEAAKQAELEQRKPCLREVAGFGAVYHPAPPNGDGALYAYDVSLSCGHTIRWPSKGRRSPKRHLTCTTCLRVKQREAIKPAPPLTRGDDGR